MASAGSASYFRRASLFWMAVIGFFLGFYTWTVFWPTQVPYAQLGPLGSLAEYLVKNYYSVMYHGFWLACAIHVAEAAIALRICSSKGIEDSGARFLWVVQTLLFGYASLSLLVAYSPPKKRK